jgi:hypothetical protein
VTQDVQDIDLFGREPNVTNQTALVAAYIENDARSDATGGTERAFDILKASPLRCFRDFIPRSQRRRPLGMCFDGFVDALACDDSHDPSSHIAKLKARQIFVFREVANPGQGARGWTT